MAQFTQRLRFDLTDTFAGNVELFTHFFQRVVGVHIDSETIWDIKKHIGYVSSTFASPAKRRMGGADRAIMGLDDVYANRPIPARCR